MFSFTTPGSISFYGTGSNGLPDPFLPAPYLPFGRTFGVKFGKIRPQAAVSSWTPSPKSGGSSAAPAPPAIAAVAAHHKAHVCQLRRA